MGFKHSPPKFGPVAGDTGVIGTVRYITRTALVNWCYFDANVTANGYDSCAADLLSGLYQSGAVGAGSLSVTNIPDDLNNGDWVTVDVVEGNYAPYATNLVKM